MAARLLTHSSYVGYEHRSFIPVIDTSKKQCPVGMAQSRTSSRWDLDPLTVHYLASNIWVAHSPFPVFFASLQGNQQIEPCKGKGTCYSLTCPFSIHYVTPGPAHLQLLPSIRPTSGEQQPRILGISPFLSGEYAGCFYMFLINDMLHVLLYLFDTFTMLQQT